MSLNECSLRSQYNPYSDPFWDFVVTFCSEPFRKSVETLLTTFSYAFWPLFSGETWQLCHFKTHEIRFKWSDFKV